MKRILVTGAGGSAASNFIHSLRISPEKFYIVGCDTKPYHLELSDANKKYLVPPASDPSYLLKLHEIIKEEKIDFIHAQPDPEVFFISKNRNKIRTRLFLPNHKTIELCQNKMELINNFSKAGISVGDSIIVDSEVTLKRGLTLLLKKHKKVWLRAIHGAGSKASLPVVNFKQAKSWIEYWQTQKQIGYGQFMMTEFLPGGEFAFQSVWNKGELITSQARERIEYIFGNLTVSGQTSSPSVAKTVHRQDINETATKAILQIDKNASGVFCIDLKENSKGTACITEINAGRFFTTSNFFSEAGSNMPYYYLKIGLGEKIPPLPKYNPIPKDWYWVRMVDMGYKLIKGEKWQSQKI